MFGSHGDKDCPKNALPAKALTWRVFFDQLAEMEPGTGTTKGDSEGDSVGLGHLTRRGLSGKRSMFVVKWLRGLAGVEHFYLESF